MTNAHLCIVGLGVNVPGHLTREAAAALSECSEVFTLVREAPASWLPKAIPVTNLMDMYVEAAVRTDNYQRVSERILASLSDNVTIAYVTYGNPLAYDSVAQRLANDAEVRGARLTVVPGISSIDTLLCDLRTDMAPGLQVFEASWLVAGQIALNVTIPAILVQIGLFGSMRAHYRNAPSPVVLKPLEEYLCRSYPRAHEVALVRSASQHEPTHIRRVALGNLSTVEGTDFLGSSMFVPALLTSALNRTILDQMIKD